MATASRVGRKAHLRQLCSKYKTKLPSVDQPISIPRSSAKMGDLASLALIYDHLQCDEGKPRCAACTRHGVSCEYVFAPSRGTPQDQQQEYRSPPSDIPYNVQGPRRDADDPHLDPLLELRLIHEWTANVCQTFTTAWEFWTYQGREM